MAEIVEQMPQIRGRGKPPKYPWDEWLDGSIWRLVRGRVPDEENGEVGFEGDFVVKPDKMRQYARNASRRRVPPVELTTRVTTETVQHSVTGEWIEVEVVYLKAELPEPAVVVEFEEAGVEPVAVEPQEPAGGVTVIPAADRTVEGMAVVREADVLADGEYPLAEGVQTTFLVEGGAISPQAVYEPVAEGAEVAEPLRWTAEQLAALTEEEINALVEVPDAVFEEVLEENVVAVFEETDTVVPVVEVPVAPAGEDATELDGAEVGDEWERIEVTEDVGDPYPVEYGGEIL